MATGDADGDGDGNDSEVDGQVDGPAIPAAPSWPIRSSQTSSVADRLPEFAFLPHELIRPHPSSQQEQFFPEIPSPSLSHRSSKTPFSDPQPPFDFLPHELIPHFLYWPEESFPEIPTPSQPSRSSQTPAADSPILLSLLPKELIPDPLLSPPKKSLPDLPAKLCNPNFRVPIPRNLPPGPWDPADVCPALSALRVSDEAEILPDYISDWEGPRTAHPSDGRGSGCSSRRKRGAGSAANQRSGFDNY